MEDKRLFKVLNNFMFRSPTGTINDYVKNSQNTNLKDVLDEDFKEGILLASSTLYDSINNYNDDYIEKKRDALRKSIIKYDIRRNMRATPFGLFSGVAMGEINGQKTEIQEQKIQNDRRARVDFNWLVEMIKKIEIDYDGYKNLKIYTNKLIIEEGAKLKNRYYSCFDYNKENVNKSFVYINNKDTFKKIFEISKNGAFLTEIIEVFRNISSNVNVKAIDHCVKDLIKNGFLFTELRQPITSTNYYEKIISILNERNIHFQELSELEETLDLIKLYNNREIKSIVPIVRKMESILDNKNYIQVDRLSNIKVNLPEIVRKDVEDLADFLYKFSYNPKVGDEFDTFKNKFTEVYGNYVEVPLLDVLNTHSDIFYKKSTHSYGNYQYSKEDEIRKMFIESKILNAIYKDSDVVIEDEDVKVFANKNTKINEILDSLELYVEIVAESVEDIDGGNYEMIVSPNIGSTGTGKTFGRFSDFLPGVDKLYSDIKTNNKEICDDEWLTCEVVSLNSVARTCNVSSTYNYNDYQLNINCCDSNEKINLDVNDLYIGMDEDFKLYIKSKSLNKKIKCVTNHMLNTDSMNSLSELVINISSERERVVPFYFFSNLQSSRFVYIPRVRYKNTILSPKTWFINKMVTKLQSNDDKESSKVLINKFIKENNIPSYVFIVDADNRLLLNLNNENHREILIDLYNKSDTIFKIQEYYGNINNTWLNINGKSYVGEFVFEIVKDSKYRIYEIEKTNQVLNKTQDTSIATDTLFANWFYMKLYYNSDRINEFIGMEMKKFISEIVDNGLINEYFFIRYKDDDDDDSNHIRLRLHLIKDSEEIYRLVDKWQCKMVKKGFVKKIVIDKYKPEINRYGGVKIFPYIEKYFCRESDMCSHYLQMNYLKELQIKPFKFGVIYTMWLLENLGLELNVQLAMLDQIINKSEKRSEFNKVRKEYLIDCNSSNNWDGLKKTKGGSIVYELLFSAINEVRGVRELLKDNGEAEVINNTNKDIIFSLIHMFCNRMYGVNREIERDILIYVRHTVQSLIGYRKKK